ncbi:NADH-quinone oxidoreductase subunit 5 family protein [Candidatus Nitrospira neomarina]|uniref:Proton-conducting transporter membrane subunit n=1 Tax=Candidatus Nitrospira neomarina TaxID=3020899 RepID=A0AA96GHQ2_9BACT|nr:proton-conducting transporter membrane subunit [Candidatus Nitrospira neomarina]WNM61492.1 proton-conducting transporter membrane subunit [Candidatus Nitrospira neomarina]
MTTAVFIPLLPLLAAMLIGWQGKRLKSRVAWLGIVATAGSTLFSFLTLYQVSTEGPFQLTFWSWGHGPSPSLTFGMLVDRLTAVMMVLISSVSTIIHLYSRRYLQGDPGYERFFGLLGLMTFTILSLVASSNFLVLFLFWQLLSWVLYLLLAFNFSHTLACEYARKTLLVHRIGDISFLCGLLLIFQYFGTFEFAAVFQRAAADPPMIRLWSGSSFEISIVPVIALLIFVGAMAKSAQFPLHVWLPDTMDSPTPVSALMHAGIINAGGFLLNRLAPLYALSPTTLHLVFIVGVLTVLLGASMMLVQNDIKKTLGFSTMGQMGYMIMECGLGAFALAIFHLIAHGFFKASLFLASGSIIQDARHEPKFPPASGHQPTRLPNKLTWTTGLLVTLFMPLIILLVAHGVLDVPLQDDHGAVIFLFFGWVTASQAIFSIYRLHAVASWKVAGAMIVTLFFIGFVYLWAGETFTHFLYPAPGVADGFFKAAAFPPQVFDAVIIFSTLVVLFGWLVLYTTARGQKILNPNWVLAIRQAGWVLLINRCYVDGIYKKTGSALLRLAQKVAYRY